MTSKILEAVQQLEHSIETLKNGKLAVDKTIQEKEAQIRELTTQYLATVEDNIIADGPPLCGASRTGFPYANFGVHNTDDNPTPSIQSIHCWNMLSQCCNQLDVTMYELERNRNFNPEAIADDLLKIQQILDKTIYVLEEDL